MYMCMYNPIERKNDKWIFEYLINSPSIFRQFNKNWVDRIVMTEGLGFARRIPVEVLVIFDVVERIPEDIIQVPKGSIVREVFALKSYDEMERGRRRSVVLLFVWSRSSRRIWFAMHTERETQHDH